MRDRGEGVSAGAISRCRHSGEPPKERRGRQGPCRPHVGSPKGKEGGGWARQGSCTACRRPGELTKREMGGGEGGEVEWRTWKERRRGGWRSAACTGKEGASIGVAGEVVACREREGGGGASILPSRNAFKEPQGGATNGETPMGFPKSSENEGGRGRRSGRGFKILFLRRVILKPYRRRARVRIFFFWKNVGFTSYPS